MARVTVLLPSLLAPVTGGRREFGLEAETLPAAFERLRGAHPELGLHLFDEDGRLREHVLCFHNETNTRWLDEGTAAALRDGDTLLFMQAVSGG